MLRSKYWNKPTSSSLHFYKSYRCSSLQPKVYSVINKIANHSRSIKAIFNKNLEESLGEILVVLLLPVVGHRDQTIPPASGRIDSDLD